LLVGVEGLALLRQPLAHVADLAAGVAELPARSFDRKGAWSSRFSIFQAHLGWHAPFASAEGRRGFVRKHPTRTPTISQRSLRRA